MKTNKQGSGETSLPEGVLQSIRYASLRQDIEGQRKFMREGIEKIREYYSSRQDKLGKKAEETCPPHELLVERARNIILLALQRMKESRFLEDEPIEYVLIGIGIETLLKAIMLDKDPVYFLDRIRGERTLSFKECADRLVEFLPEGFTLKQARRLNEVLELIQLKRNNLAHLGFHYEGVYREDYQIAHTLESLFSHFFGGSAKEVVEKLQQLKMRGRDSIGQGIDYEPVEFQTGVKG